MADEAQAAAWFATLRKGKRRLVRTVFQDAYERGPWLLSGYGPICETFKRRGLLRWNREARGYELTDDGRALRSFLRRHP